MSRMLPVLLALALVTPGAAQAQQPVAWKAETGVRRVAQGDTFTLVVTAAIDFGWHIYSLTQASGPVPTRLTLPEGQPFARAAPATSTEPAIKFDESFGIVVESHEVEVTFNLPVRVVPGASSNVRGIKVHARYQACSASICLPPRIATLSAPIAIKARPMGARLRPTTVQHRSSVGSPPLRPDSPPVWKQENHHHNIERGGHFYFNQLPDFSISTQ